MLRFGRSLLPPSLWDGSLLIRSFSLISSSFPHTQTHPRTPAKQLSSRRGVLRFFSQSPKDNGDDDETTGNDTHRQRDEGVEDEEDLVDYEDYEDNVEHDDREEEEDADSEIDIEDVSRESSVSGRPMMKDMLKMIEMEIKRFQNDEDDEDEGSQPVGESKRNGTKKMTEFLPKRGTKAPVSRKSRNTKGMKPLGSSLSGNETDEVGSIPKKVLLFPLYQRPIFPGVEARLIIHDSVFARQVQEAADKKKRLGMFFVDDEFIQSAKKSSRYPNVTSIKHVHDVGVIGRIVSTHQREGNDMEIRIQGMDRICVEGEEFRDGRLFACIKPKEDHPYDPENMEIKAHILGITNAIQSAISASTFFKTPLEQLLNNMDTLSASEISYMAAALTNADPSRLQKCLSIEDVLERLKVALILMREEKQIGEMHEKIMTEVDDKIRKETLRMQMQLIRKELGMEEDGGNSVTRRFRDRIKDQQLPPAALEVIEEEIKRLDMLDPRQAEYQVCMNYLDWLTILPWSDATKDELVIDRAEQILNRDHHGLDDIKKRMLEFIAVGKLKGGVQGKILCFVGPPGTGKTSIGKSIAESLGRTFYRFSVGGMTDVAEIKGHRRTYVGAMPGKVLQAMKIVRKCNPVIMIDEIDKLGRSHTGDPASALLETLDPEQNTSFLDHFLDTPFDLSRVLFVCTANQEDTIPSPLLDRMEVMRMSGYVSEEKLAIAKKHLLPQAMLECGLTGNECEIMDDALKELIQSYSREAGVRGLQKMIEKILRKVSLHIVRHAQKQESGNPEKKEPEKPDFQKVVVTKKNVGEYAGKPLFSSDRYYDVTPPGVVTGLAWTPLGGAILYIETVAMTRNDTPKNGTLLTTGQLGNVMEESSKIAYTFSKNFLQCRFPVNESVRTFLSSKSIHMHIPEGAIPKDGPSAGCAMTTALLSLAMGIPVRQNLSMTGEITLTGKILPIGGVREKIIAAKRSGITTICLPLDNMKDWDELADYIREGIDVHFVDHYRSIFPIAFDYEGSELKMTEAGMGNAALCESQGVDATSDREDEFDEC
uniref:Lon protease homolog n=1 Tax=Stygiella incarcerata TaxID=1712417 RepID=A0A192ZIE8_9EUKA|nr:lon protease-like protein [Stygiella incarcerata]